MTDTHELEDLLNRVPVPQADVRADVARGEVALRRRRVVAGVGAGVVAAVVVMVAAVAGGAPRAIEDPSFATSSTAPSTDTSTAPSTDPSSPTSGPTPRRTPRVAGPPLPDGFPELPADRSVLVGFRDAIADHLEGGERWLRFADNAQGSGTAIGTKLDWRDGGMLEVVVGSRWDDLGSFYDLDAADLRPTTYRGLDARVGGRGGDEVVSVRHRDGTVVSLVGSPSFGNNGTRLAAHGISRAELLEAAADHRLRRPVSR